MRKYLFICAVAALAAVLATAAFAAPPPRVALPGNALRDERRRAQEEVRLVVTKTGTSARVIWWCGEGRAPSTLRVQIAADGAFKGTSNVGTLTVWGVKGRFVSATKARMALQLKTICMRKGGTVNLELQS